MTLHVHVHVHVFVYVHGTYTVLYCVHVGIH